MKNFVHGLWHSEVVRSILTVPAVVAGLVLPLDFISQVDGYLMYLRPWELLPIYGWAWVFHIIFGLVIGILVAAAIGIVALFRRNSLSVIAKTELWLALSITVLAFVKDGKVWMESHGFGPTAFWLSTNQRWIWAFILFSCAIWVRHVKNRLNPFKKLALGGTVCGLMVTLCALVMSAFTASPAPVPPFHQQTHTTTSKLPDIVLLTVDALAANHLSVYGYPRSTTPYLDDFAKEAHVFNRFYANSNFTTPSTNSFINGVRPWTHRAMRLLSIVGPDIADNGLIARLQRTGYQTFAVTTNPVASPFHISSDRWINICVSGRTHDTSSIIQSTLGRSFPHLLPTFNLSVVGDSCNAIDHLLVLTGVWQPADHFDPELAFTAARRLAEQRDRRRPMFLWIHLLSPHSPYATTLPYVGLFDPSAKHRTRFDSTPPRLFYASTARDFPGDYVNRYDEAVASTDASIGGFLQWLKRKGMYREGLIAISADHGESFSHGYGGHGGPMLCDDVIHIPLLIKEPSQIVGAPLDVLAEQIDLMPTILDLAGLPIEGSVEGRSLRPAIFGAKMDQPVFSMNFEQASYSGPLDIGSVAMIEGKWKFVHYFGPIHYPMMPKLEDSLYDLQADPGEMMNLASAQPTIATTMLAAIEDQLRRHGGVRP